MQRRVLIIDDEQETCDLIERVVSYLGMEALTLKSSAQAVDLLERNKFDLVILDFHMASPDGVELARLVRQMRMNRMTPVVLISDDQRPSAVAIGFEARPAATAKDPGPASRPIASRSSGRRVRDD